MSTSCSWCSGQFSSNVALGMLATGAAQGTVAAVGFAIAGLDAVVALGVATAVFSVVPVVGSAVIWVPAAGVLLANGEIGWAVFVAVWSLGLTASVDNIIKPFILRSGLQVSPLIMLMALVGGGLMWGAQGLITGPLLLLLFLTLFTFYRRGLPADSGGRRGLSERPCSAQVGAGGPTESVNDWLRRACRPPGSTESISSTADTCWSSAARAATAGSGSAARRTRVSGSMQPSTWAAVTAASRT